MRTLTFAGVLLAIGCGSGQGGAGHAGAAGSTGGGGSHGAAGSSVQGAAGAGGTAANAGAGGSAGSSTGSAGTSSDGIEAVQQALSGTRLKAYWYTASDGSKQFALNWYDSQLQTDCYFNRGADGTTRCLPSFMGGTPLYSDAGCLNAVAIAVPKATCGTANSKWVSFNVPNTNGACPAYKTLYFNVGGPFTGSAYYGTPGPKSCNPLPTSADAGYNPYPATTYDFLSLASPLDLSMFQAGTYAHD